MKSMKTLVRVKQREIDELRRKQTLLETKREEVYKTIDMLAQRLADERKAAESMPDMAHFFGDFSAHIQKRQEQLYVLARRTEVEIEKLAVVIRELFSELKKYELAYSNWEIKEKAKRARLEAQQLDEIAIMAHARKQHAE
jgi:hypothetical protein